MRIIMILVAGLLSGVAVHAQRSEKTGEMTKPYYLHSFFISVNTGIHFLSPNKATFPPVYIHPELTVARNVTLGPQLLMYKYKHFVQYTTDNSPTGNRVLFPEDKTVYTHTYIGLKGAYHLRDLFEKLLSVKINKVYDFYGSLMAGYNFVSLKTESAYQEPASDSEEARLRVGALAGMKVIRNRRVGGFVELGYSDYGFGTVGLSWFLSNSK